MENQRVRLTKKLIQDALLEMLDEQDVHQVHVRALCDKAGINRTTFYKHYASPVDVLTEISDTFLKSIDSMLDAAKLDNINDLQKRIELILNYVLKNLTVSRFLINSNIDKAFAEKLFSLPMIESLKAQTPKRKLSESERDTFVLFSVYGAYNLIKDWINDEKRANAKEESRLIIKIVMTITGIS